MAGRRRSRPPTFRRPPTRRDRIPINATVPAVAAAEVPEVLARFPGARTAKVKVAEPGQTLADDVDRVDAVRAQVPTVRVDANGGWTVAEAVEADHRARCAGVRRTALQDRRRTGRGAPPRRRADRRRRKHPQGRRPAVGRACRRGRRRGAEGRPAGRCRQVARHRRADRCPRGGVQRAGFGRRHRPGSARGGGAARTSARLRAGHRRVVRRGRRRTADAGRRPSAGRAGRSRSGPAGRRWPRRPSGVSGGSTASRPASRQGAQTSWPNNRNGHSAVVVPKATNSEPAGTRVFNCSSIRATSSAWRKVHTIPTRCRGSRPTSRPRSSPRCSPFG